MNKSTYQTVVTWYDPMDRLPDEPDMVIVSLSGFGRNIKCDHMLAVASYDEEVGWIIDSIDPAFSFRKFVVHAWCDLVPYGGEA